MCLIHANGRVLNREQLLDGVWGYAGAAKVESRTVDVHIRRLREKLDSEPTRIVTVKGMGYDAILPYAARGWPLSALHALAQRYGATLGARVTILDVDGAVMGEFEWSCGEVRGMANQQDWPEVRVALPGGVDSHVRWEQDLHRDMLYVAIPVAEPIAVKGVLRMALPLTEVNKAAALVRRTVILGALLAFGVVLFISRRVTRPVTEMQAIARRVAEGNLSPQVPITGSDEIAGLGPTLNLIAERLNEKIRDLGGACLQDGCRPFRAWRSPRPP